MSLMNQSKLLPLFSEKKKKILLEKDVWLSTSTNRPNSDLC